MRRDAWGELATSLGYEDVHTMLETEYGKKGLKAMAAQLAMSVATLKRALAENNVPLRRRGGPRFKLAADAMNQDLLTRIEKEGLVAVAASLGVSKFTLYQRKKKFIGAQPASTTAEPQTSTPTETCPDEGQ